MPLGFMPVELGLRNIKERRNNLKKRILALTISILVVLAVLIVPMLALAGDNEATQEASTSKATSISIVAKEADTAITTITFPEGAPDATISDPHNDVDTDTDKQVLHASTSEPVVRLKNTSAGTLSIWLEITTWSGGVVASEDYELVDTTDVAVVDDVLSADGNAASVDTTVTIAAEAYKALYLEITLSSSSGASGTSTLSVLGES